MVSDRTQTLAVCVEPGCWLAVCDYAQQQCGSGGAPENIARAVLLCWVCWLKMFCSPWLLQTMLKILTCTSTLPLVHTATHLLLTWVLQCQLHALVHGCWQQCWGNVSAHTGLGKICGADVSIQSSVLLVIASTCVTQHSQPAGSQEVLHKFNKTFRADPLFGEAVPQMVLHVHRSADSVSVSDTRT